MDLLLKIKKYKYSMSVTMSKVTLIIVFSKHNLASLVPILHDPGLPQEVPLLDERWSPPLLTANQSKKHVWHITSIHLQVQFSTLE